MYHFPLIKLFLTFFISMLRTKKIKKFWTKFGYWPKFDFLRYCTCLSWSVSATGESGPRLFLFKLLLLLLF